MYINVKIFFFGLAANAKFHIFHHIFISIQTLQDQYINTEWQLC